MHTANSHQVDQCLNGVLTLPINFDSCLGREYPLVLVLPLFLTQVTSIVGPVTAHVKEALLNIPKLRRGACAVIGLNTISDKPKMSG